MTFLCVEWTLNFNSIKEGAQRVHISAKWVWGGPWVGREMGCMREMADALREGHTLLKTGLSAHRHTVHTHL